MKYTKLQLIKKLSEDMNFPTDVSKDFVNSYFRIKKQILLKNDLKISKFGSFIKKISPERIGRNPKTMEEFVIKKKEKIHLVPSKKVKDYIN